jgi:hypothetical protein
MAIKTPGNYAAQSSVRRPAGLPVEQLLAAYVRIPVVDGMHL